MIIFEFNSFKTPSSIVGANLPKSMFFTFKFYKMRSVQSEKVDLRRPEDLETNDYAEKPIQHATHYYLVP